MFFEQEMSDGNLMLCLLNSSKLVGKTGLNLRIHYSLDSIGSMGLKKIEFDYVIEC